jgi:methionyl-tRNA formyltransferase
MKIIFFGSSEFSVTVLTALLASPHQVVHVITTPDQKKGRGQKVSSNEVRAFAEAHLISVTAPEKLATEEVIETFKTRSPDTFVIASYGKIIPLTIINLAKKIPLNVHPSLLPKYRGASPIQSAILNGEPETGVSIAELTGKLDSGDVLGQSRLTIGENENACELSKRLADLGAKLLLETLEKIEKNTFSRVPQEDTNSTYAHKIEKEAGKIDWTRPAQTIHNQVRAFFPWPSAFTSFRGKRIKILETRVSNSLAAPAQPNQPGTIVNLSAECLSVQTGSGLIAVTQVQLEGGRAMDATDFAHGQRLSQTERFES